MPQNELWQLSANRAEESEGEAGDTLDYADISKRINKNQFDHIRSSNDPQVFDVIKTKSPRKEKKEKKS